MAAHEELIHGTQRAARLVQQLLDFARLEPGANSEPHGLIVRIQLPVHQQSLAT